MADDDTRKDLMSADAEQLKAWRALPQEEQAERTALHIIDMHGTLAKGADTMRKHEKRIGKLEDFKRLFYAAVKVVAFAGVLTGLTVTIWALISKAIAG